MYEDLINQRIAEADPLERDALAVRIIQDMIAEIDYEIIKDLSNNAHMTTIQNTNYMLLDRHVGEWMVKQSVEEVPYKYDPREGF